MAGIQDGTGEELRRRTETILLQELRKAPDRQDQELIFQCQRALSGSERQCGRDSDDVIEDLDVFKRTVEPRSSAYDVEQLDQLRTNGWWLPRRKNPWRHVVMPVGKVVAALLFLVVVIRFGCHEVTGDSIYRVLQELGDGILLTQQVPNTRLPVVYDDLDNYVEDPAGFLAIPKTLPDGYCYDGAIKSMELSWGMLIVISYSNVNQDLLTIQISIPKDNRPIQWGIEVDSEEIEVYEINGIEFLLCRDGDLTKCQWRVGANNYILQSTASSASVREFLSYIENY